MDVIIDLLQKPFTLGLLLGLLITFFVWKSNFAARRNLKKEIRRITDEGKELQTHLNTHLKVQAEGAGSLQGQLDDMREQNETLRVNIANLQQKPGKAELRHLHIVENAVGFMREQAPGFAQAWEQAMRQAEINQSESENGLKRLVRKVIPSIGNSSANVHEVTDEKKK